MDAAAVDLDRPLRLYPLTFLEEGDEVTVGRADIDSYGLFPADGAALLRRLETGETPNDAARWYNTQYGETVDMVEFLEVLEAFELLVPDGEEVAEVRAVRWQGLGKALFSPVAWVLYGLLFIAGIVAMFREPAVVPTYQNIFFTSSSLVALALGNVLGQAPWILLHESYHALAGRRLGLNSSLSIGRRFYYVVFLTKLDGLVAVPRRKRYLPMLAGMLVDVLVVTGLTLGAVPLVSSDGFAGFLGRFLLAMAFGTLLRFAWQFYFFLRTDLYFLATTVLGCNDLQSVAKGMLQNRLYGLIGRRDKIVDAETWTPRDREVARWYVWLMVTGYAVLTGLLITAVIPAAIRITGLAVGKLFSDTSPLNVLDVTVFLVLNFGELILAGILAVRGYRRRTLATAN
ncbi:hypothetical protein QMK19_09230 [Streptomyces sp. H10-C2]|uniref:hypothetical protein n=1 Tax=unclassified Streptomyces TaxID=2593676 RepID=UPI0024B91E4D|nr:MULTISPECIES: hypothetical protein [unclassified Streptomyces]MDJ0340912.1 hypothetical protein [Streptomyces sp. PH10-H1]MDJ0369856.1 hypothetical protein [Streptomyces sp. H10-C2]